MNKNQRQLTVKEMLDADGLKVSIYMPTHRAYPDNRKDPIVYKNILQEIEKSLSEKHPRRDWEELLARLYRLVDDSDFWRHTTDSIGVLANGNRAETFLLEQTLTPSFMLGFCFNLTPLFHLSDTVNRAYLADISKDRFRMFTVSNNNIREIDPPSIKSSFPELFDDYDNNSTLRTGSYRGLGGAFHGQGGRARQAEVDREKYFRYLDGSFQRIHDDTGLPMIIAGTEGTIAEFMKLAKGDFYFKDSITQPIESIEANDLQSRLKTIMESYSKYRLESLSTVISNKRNENKAVSEPAQILRFAEQGNIESLILSSRKSEVDQDTINVAAEETIRYGGTIIVMDDEEIGVTEKALALLRSSS